MLDLSSNRRFWNLEDEISAKSQTLSLELKNFNFFGFISTSFGCIGASTIFKKLFHNEENECLDMYSKYVVIAVKIFENQK